MKAIRMLALTLATIVPTTALSADFLDTGQALGNGAARDVELADLDGDGDLDAYVVNFATGDRVWLGDGAGGFTDSGQALGVGRGFEVALADFDGDGDLDAYVAKQAVPNQIWINDGAANFTDSGAELGTAASFGVALGDVDGDSNLDAVSADANGATIWLGDGNAGFVQGGQFGAGLIRDVSLADLDDDGDLDAFVTKFGQPDEVWLGDGDGGFTDSGQQLGQEQGTRNAVADLDGDGVLDVVVANDGSNTAWLGLGDGTFARRQILGHHTSWDVVVRDLDSDGDPDAVFANLDGGGRIWWGDGDGTFTKANIAVPEGTGRGVAVGPLDESASPDLYLAMVREPGNRVLLRDTDNDGVTDGDDGDDDGDGEPDGSDLCPLIAADSHQDGDGDGVGDLCDLCPDLPSIDADDADQDGTGDHCDNCPNTRNRDQADLDGDGDGDRCDDDDDGDGLSDDVDNCPRGVVSRRANGSTFGDIATTNGNASVPDDRLRVTNTSGQGERQGSVFLNDRMNLGADSSFSTSFHVALHAGSGNNGAHGLTFVLHDDPSGAGALGSGAGGLGYQGITSSVAVEFDTDNSNNGDPNGNHIAVLANGAVNDHLAVRTNPGIGLNDQGDDGFFVWIEYNGVANELAIYLSQQDLRPESPTLTHTIDIPSIVGNQPYVGFTAASKRTGNHHDVYAWQPPANHFNTDQTDGDGDGVGDVCDNCPVLSNPSQLDIDGDF